MPKTKLDSAHYATAAANSVAKQSPALHTQLAKSLQRKRNICVQIAHGKHAEWRLQNFLR